MRSGFLSAGLPLGMSRRFCLRLLPRPGRRMVLSGGTLPAQLRSLPVRTEADDYRMAVVQVLAIQCRLLSVRGLPKAVGEENLMMGVTCQPLEVWGSSELDMDRRHLEVFPLQEPQEMDLLLVCGTDPAMRCMIRRWLPAAASCCCQHFDGREASPGVRVCAMRMRACLCVGLCIGGPRC